MSHFLGSSVNSQKIYTKEVCLKVTWSCHCYKGFGIAEKSVLVTRFGWLLLLQFLSLLLLPPLAAFFVSWGNMACKTLFTAFMDFPSKSTCSLNGLKNIKEKVWLPNVLFGFLGFFNCNFCYIPILLYPLHRIERKYYQSLKFEKIWRIFKILQSHSEKASKLEHMQNQNNFQKGSNK